MAQDGANRNLPILEARPFRGVGGQFLDRHVERNIGQHQISAWIVPSRTAPYPALIGYHPGRNALIAMATDTRGQITGGQFIHLDRGVLV